MVLPVSSQFIINRQDIFPSSLSCALRTAWCGIERIHLFVVTNKQNSECHLDIILYSVENVYCVTIVKTIFLNFINLYVRLVRLGWLTLLCVSSSVYVLIVVYEHA